MLSRSFDLSEGVGRFRAVIGERLGEPESETLRPPLLQLQLSSKCEKGGWNGDGAIFFHSLEGLLSGAATSFTEAARRLGEEREAQMVSRRDRELQLLDPFTLRKVEARAPAEWDGSVSAVRDGGDTFFLLE